MTSKPPSPDDASTCIKKAIIEGNCTSEIVQQLRELIQGLSTKQNISTKSTAAAGHARAKSTVSKTSSGRQQQDAATKRAGASRTKSVDLRVAPPALTVRTLSEHAKECLATEVVNVVLKALSAAVKAKHKQKSTAGSPVLSEVAENARKLPTQNRKSGTGNAGVQNIAECGRIAFGYLQAKHGSEQSSGQLVSGILAFVGRLVALSFYSIAYSQLRDLKVLLSGSLEPASKTGLKKPTPASSKQKEPVGPLINPETLASLVDFGQWQVSDDVLQSVIDFQSHAFVLMQESRNICIERTYTAFCEENSASPLTLLKRLHDLDDNNDRPLKQLERFAQTILNTTLSDTRQDKDTNRPSTSKSMVWLRSLGIQMRTEWMRRAGHETDLETEIFDPFSTAMENFLKDAENSPADQFRILKREIKLVEDNVRLLKVTKTHSTPAQCPSYIKICLELSRLAERTGDMRESKNWMKNQSNNESVGTEVEAVQCTLALRKTTIAIKSLKDDEDTVSSAENAANECVELLKGHIKGKPSDIKSLFAEMNTLRKISAVRLRSCKEASAIEVGLRERVAELCRTVIFALVSFLTRLLESENNKESEDARKILAQLTQSCIKSALSALDTPSSHDTHLASAKQVAEHCLELAQNVDNLRLQSPSDIDLKSLRVTISNIFCAMFQRGQKVSSFTADHALEALHYSCKLLDVSTVDEKREGQAQTKLHYLARLYEFRGAIKESVKTHQKSLRIAVELEILATLNREASRSPLRQVCQSNQSAVLLGKTLDTMLRLASKSPEAYSSRLLIDESDIAGQDRGLLLEWQLLILSSWPKTGKLPNFVHSQAKLLSSNLLSLYTLDEHPVRRARSIALALQIIPQEANLVDAAAKILITEQSSAAEGDQDREISRYKSFWKDIIKVALAFRNPARTVAELQEVLTKLQNSKTSQASRSETALEDYETLLTTLVSMATYFEAQGLSHENLQARLLILQFTPKVESSNTVIDAAWSLHELGCSEKGLEYLESTEDSSPESLQYHLCLIEIATTLGKIDDHQKSVSKLESFVAASEHEDKQSSNRERQKLDFEDTLLRARAYYVYSKLNWEQGRLHSSIFFARQAVKWYQRLWKYIDSNNIVVCATSSDANDSHVEELANDLSNMQITDPGAPSGRGLLYWRLLPLYFCSLIHTADTLESCGLVQDALHYVTQAVRVADTANAQALAARALTVKGRIESKSNDLEQASLSLSDPGKVYQLLTTSKDACEFHCALAALHGALEEFDDQDEDYDQAENTLNNLESMVSKIHGDIRALRCSSPVAVRESKESKGRTKLLSAQPKSSPTSFSVSRESSQVLPSQLISLRSDVQRRKVEAMLARGSEDCPKLADASDALRKTGELARHARTRVSVLLRKAFDELSHNPVYGTLVDSALSLPNSIHFENEKCNSSPVKKSTKKTKPSPGQLPQELRDSANIAAALSGKSTHLVDLHVMRQMLHDQATTLLLLSFDSPTLQPQTRLNPAHVALHLDSPASLATSRALANSLMESVTAPEPFDQSNLLEKHALGEEMTDNLTSILPSTWNVVSLSLSNDQKHLYIVRYRREQEPLILRLPLVRQSEHELDDEDNPFGFEDGTVELSDIIEQSDRIVHKARDFPEELAEKGAKSSWWSEREELDQRLGDLLQNIENMWLGGFKGILANNDRDFESLKRLQADMEQVFENHLPSRKKAKKPKTDHKPKLDPQLFELFAGLAELHENSLDLAESLEDLLYFAVDIFQFHGEHNAYDEIDFDAMTVKTLDALNTYREAWRNSASAKPTRHSILVLDKQLQAFPWESLNCLTRQSVSRVCSIADVRDRILAAKQQQLLKSNVDGISVKTTGGCYVLNPSGDLSRTQKRLEPALKTLHSWSKIANRKPAEAEFISALSPNAAANATSNEAPAESSLNLNTSLLLYFGHGPGTQYIRHRSIKKLRHANTSCATALLFGCSSASLVVPGEFTEYGTPKSYLHGGAPAVMGSLWDITDGDCDAFARGVLTRWGLCSVDSFPNDEDTHSSSSKSKKPRNRERSKGPHTEDLKSRIRTEMASLQETGRKLCLSEAVARSRDDCYLKYLNGAAMVVYGVPVFLDS